MYSSYKIEGYVFDTVALRDALQEIEYDRNLDPGYSPEALEVLLKYFCDWGPNVGGASEYDYVNTPPHEVLHTLAESEKEAHYEDFSERLSRKLNEQYSLEVTADDVRSLAHSLAEDRTEDTQYDFFLRYIRGFAEHLDELDPETEGGERSIQGFLDRTRSLPSDYLDTKREQYSGSEKINKIRFRLLRSFEQAGDASPGELKRIKREVSEEYETDILLSYRDYTILGQIYYDFFKIRLDSYIESAAGRLVDEFEDVDLTYHLSNFQAPRNKLGTHAWIALHTPPKGTQTDKHQLYMGVHPDRVTVGLHVGGNRREGDWEKNRDLTEIDVDDVSLDAVTEKFHEVEEDFRWLEDGTRREGQEVKKPEDAENIARQLESKKQVVFYGPPGTGKTYVAQNFARWWTSEQDVDSPPSDRVETVTFHPSFTYEDFIEGLSADSDETGAVKYAIEDGVLKRISKNARDDYNAADDEEGPRYVLVIDEINRGNIAQIFGETITLLEEDKRGDISTHLAHSDNPFTIPPNLYVIGTMNTADRSISLVDAALRRRFRFLPFPPDFDVPCEHHGIESPKEAAETETNGYRVLLSLSILALEQINEKILASPDLGKGKQIGHSYLMGVEDTQDIVDTWKYDILPLLEEYYFSQFDRIRQEIFEGAGGEIVDWGGERVRDFDADDLLTTLEKMVKIDATIDGVEKRESESESGSSDYSKYPNALKKAQEEIYPRVRDVLNAEDITDISNESSELDRRRTLEFWSQSPSHPPESDLSYFFKPEPERNGQHAIHLHTKRDDNELFEFITSNPDRYEREGFEVTSPDDSNNRFRIVQKTYETEDVKKGEGSEIVKELMQSEVFEESIDDFVRLVEITHELFREKEFEPESTEPEEK